MFSTQCLRTGSLWPPIIVHALRGFATFALGTSVGHATMDRPMPAEAMPRTSGSDVTPVLPIMQVLPHAIQRLWLMRDIGRTHGKTKT